jgi:DnaJ like chaperone protein
VFERFRTPPERSVAFTIAVIALGAKMAKADGQVTRDEVAAFRSVFTIPEGEEAHAARVFNLARSDVAGFEAWAARIAAMFGAGSEVLKDLLEGLFIIAMADGEYHDAEDIFLREVARIFGLSDLCFQSIRARVVPNAPLDPFAILGVRPDTPFPEIRAAWRLMARDSHPDRAKARRMVAINQAWQQIKAMRRI